MTMTSEPSHFRWLAFYGATQEMPTRHRRLFETFVKCIAEEQHKPQRGLLRDVLRGLYVSKDSMLSNWARALREPHKLMYTAKRLSRGLRSKRLDDRKLIDATLTQTAALAKKHCDAVSLDSTDITKRYAKKMPHLAYVPDGSEDHAVAPGWMVLRADAIAANGRHVPIHIETFSREAPEYRGDNPQLRAFLQTIYAKVPKWMPLVVDAGYDGKNFRKMFHDQGLKFTVRLTLQGRARARVLESGETLGEFVDAVGSTNQFRVKRFTKHAKRSWVVEVGWRANVQFAGETKKYSVVVVRDRKHLRPIALLTTNRVRTDLQAQAVVDLYYSRWGVEDGHRLLKNKETFNLENLRVLTWTGLKRLVFLVHVAYAFMAWLVYEGVGEELAALAPAFGPVPKFIYYRLAMALAFLFAG